MCPRELGPGSDDDKSAVTGPVTQRVEEALLRADYSEGRGSVDGDPESKRRTCPERQGSRGRKGGGRRACALTALV